MSTEHKGKKKHKRRKNGHWKQLVLVIIILAVVVIPAIRLVTRSIKLELNGDSEVVVEVGSFYEELGANAEYGHTGFSILRNQPLAVRIAGNVDTTTIGEYKVTYKTAHGSKSKEITRTVRVADTQKPVITLKTNEDYYTPIGQAYEEEGYEAIDSYDGDITDRVVRDEPGDGTVRYTVRDNAGNEAVVVRNIPYDDRTIPEITLDGELEMVIDYESEYLEPGYRATDDVDGDITSKVVVTTAPGEKKNQLVYTYTVSDEHGNVTTATRTVLRMDPDLPTLLLEGDEVVTLTGGAWFKEPGFIATDKKDGDLAESVKVEGEVEYWHVGTYTLNYSVKDSDGNVATAQRTVVVKARELPEPIDPGPMTIYLTFDDGPSQYTAQLLDVLAKYDVKATFFVTHNHKEADEMILREHAEGHTVAIHTYTHDYSKIYKSEKAYFDDMNRMGDIIEGLIGERPAIIRFPGGSSNHVSKNYADGIMTKLTQDMNEMGILYYDWNVDSRDASGDSPKNSTEWWDPLVNNVISGIKNRSKNGRFSVVLQHDVKKFSVAAVEDIIKWGLENGYTFKALDLTTPTTGGVHQGVWN